MTSCFVRVAEVGKITSGYVRLCSGRYINELFLNKGTTFKTFILHVNKLKILIMKLCFTEFFSVGIFHHGK